MSRRLDVLKALLATVEAALPGATVLGLDGDEAAASIVPATGRVVLRSGDPGVAEIDLSPLTYNYQHRIPVEIAAMKSGGLTSEEALDVMLTAVGEAIDADRTLGGLCTWLEAVAPETEDIFVENARPPRGADLIIVAHYATISPLA